MGNYYFQNKFKLKQNGDTYELYANINNEIKVYTIQKHITITQIEEWIKDIDFSEYFKYNKLEKNTIFEEGIFMPFSYMFHFSFIKNIIENKYVDFCEFYINSCLDYLPKLDKYRFKESCASEEVCQIFLSKGDIYARIGRLYNSFIRELYILIVLNEYKENHNCNFNIYYDIFYDLDGIDIVIENNSKKYGIAIFDETKRAKDYKLKKFNRHKYINENILIHKNKETFLDEYIEMFEFITQINNKSNKIGNTYLPVKSNIEDFFLSKIKEVSNV